MKVTAIGVGSASPQLGKNPSAFLVGIENEFILIDCGEGTQYRLLERSVKLSRLKTICISHLHGDHYFGLIGLLSSMNLSGRIEPITLIGPSGLLSILNSQFVAAKTKLNYELNFSESNVMNSEFILERKYFKIEGIPLIHRVDCIGFKIIQRAGKRHVRADKLPRSFPIPLIKQLIEGKDVLEPLTGKFYSAKKFTYSGEPEKSFAYCSDTAYNPAMIPILEAVDLVYHEATFTKELEDRAEKTQHSTAEQAAMIGRDAKVKRMLLGHLSSRYKSSEGHLIEAKNVFERVEMAEEGKVYEIN